MKCSFQQVELSMDINYTGGFELAIDATTKFNKTATIKNILIIVLSFCLMSFKI